MTLKRILLTIIYSVLYLHITAQTIEGYSFEKYGIRKQSVKKKAEINYESNPTARKFRTRITQGYKSGKIDFAGYYITVKWGCGTGCISGAMVDTRDGKVYDLPLNEQTAYNLCFSSYENDDDDRYSYKASSRLFITTICREEQVGDGKNFKQDKTFLINIWNEQKKRFEPIDKIKRSYTKEKKE